MRTTKTTRTHGIGREAERSPQYYFIMHVRFVPETEDPICKLQGSTQSNYRANTPLRFLCPYARVISGRVSVGFI